MRIATNKNASTSTAYLERVNLAIDYVFRHIGKPLRLEEVSRAAFLSPFHFHRVFRAIAGVTLADFIKRIRLEKALSLMAHSGKLSLTKIALASGFSSSSDFSRCFKQRFGAAPSRFDLDQWRNVHRNEVHATSPRSADRLHIDHLPARRNPDCFRVRIRELPAREVAYIRVRNPYRGDAVAKAAERLVRWAERHGSADNQWLGYQWDNPEITALEDCQYHVAVEAEQVTARGEIGRFHFPRMVVAEVEMRGGIDLEIRAMQWLFGTWLPKSGYVPDDHPCLEAWMGRPFAHGMGHFELHVQLPIRRG